MISPNKLDLFRQTVSVLLCICLEGARRQKGGVQPQAVQGGSMLTGVPTEYRSISKGGETAWAVTSEGCYHDCQDANTVSA